jgi:hypothetical protein
LRLVRESVVSRLAGMSRTVAAGLLARVWRGGTAADLDERLAALPAARQAVIVGGTVGLLFLSALFAAQFGWIGLLVFGIAVVLLVG